MIKYYFMVISKNNYKSTITALWDITSKCNLQCLHCYNASKYFYSNRKYDLVFNYGVEKIIQKISCLSVTHLHLLGGEPLLSPNIWDILKFSEKYNIAVSINTNGTLLNSQKISKLSKFKNLSQIVISLDGPNAKVNDEIRGKGTFKKVIKNIHNLIGEFQNHKRNLVIAINTVITEHNANYLKEFPNIMKYLGIKHLLVSTLYDCGNANKNKMLGNKYFDRVISNLIKLLDISQNTKDIFVQFDAKPKLATYINRLFGNKIVEVEPFKCGAVNEFIFIDSNGFIYPCGSITQEIHNFKIDYNLNIMDVGIGKEFSLNKIFNNFSKVKRNTHTTYCRKCEFINICSGICPLYYKKSPEDIPLECKTVDFFQTKLFNSILSKSYIIINREKCKINNHIEKLIMKLIDDGDKVKEIINKLINNYKINGDILLNDVCGYISDLVVDGIIIEKIRR